MIRMISRRAAVVIGGVLMSAGVASAADRNEPTVEYRDVGQSRVILPVYREQREAPYALTGRASRAADAWESQGHWINAGQTRVYVPAVRPDPSLR